MIVQYMNLHCNSSSIGGKLILLFKLQDFYLVYPKFFILLYKCPLKLC